MATFGQTGDSASNVGDSADRKRGSKFTCPTSGTLEKFTARVWIDGTGSAPARGVLYSDNAGAPDALLATGDEVTVSNTSEAAVDFPFSGGAQYALVGSTDYWLVIHHQDPGTDLFRHSCDATASGHQRGTDTYSDGPSDPFGTPTALEGILDLYATYSVPPAFGTVSTPQTFSGLTTWTVNAPASVGDGDLLIAYLGRSGTSRSVTSAPSGWTLLGGAAVDDTDTRLWVYWKLASSEGASWDWTFDATPGRGTAFVVRVTGANQTTPINQSSAGTTASGTTHVSPSITPSVSACLIVSVVLIDTKVRDADFAAAAGTWDDRAEGQSSGTLVMSLATKTQTAAAALTHSWTSDSADTSNQYILAVAPV